jgi:hypothetical protein
MGTQTVNVDPATRDHYEVTMTTNVNAGTYYNITVIAKDQFDNTDANCSDVVTFLTNNPPTYYDLPTDNSLVSGQRTWAGAEGVQLNKSSWTAAGNLLNPWYVRAEKDDDSSKNGQVSNIKVIPKATSKFSVTGIVSPIGAGVEDAFYVTALDEYDNRDVNYASTVTFTSDNSNWYVVPSTYGFDATVDKGKHLFSKVAFMQASPPNFYLRAYQSNPFDLSIDGEQSPIQVDAVDFSSFTLTGIADPQKLGYTSYDVEVKAIDQFGNVYKNYNSTVAFDCATDLSMSVVPSQYWFQASDQGISTFTVTMNTETFEHDVQVYDVNDTAKKGWQYGVTVVTEPVSAETMPSNDLHINSIPNLLGTAYAYNPAQINNVEIKLYCEDGPAAEDNDFWQGGGSWDTGEIWLPVTSGTTDWSKTKPNTWPKKAGSSAAKFHLWTRAYDNLGSTETVGAGDYIVFYYDEGDPQTGVYQPSSEYVNSKPVLTGTAVDPPGAPLITNAPVTKVEIAIKYINAGTTNYWEHYVSSGTWQVTEMPLWFDAPALDGNYDGEAEEDWQWDSDEVDWQNQKEHFVYSRAYDDAGNMEDPPTEKKIIYDQDACNSAITLPAGGSQNYSSMNSIQGTAYDAQGIDYVQISIKEGSNYFNVSSWAFDEPVENNAWIVCSGSISWSWDSSTVTWNPGTTYTVRSKATDKAANPESPGAGKAFIYDTASPSSLVQYPQEDPAYDKVNDSTDTLTIYGTANDADSNVSSVEIVIRKGAGSNYWDGNDWDSSSPVWLTVNLHPSSWTYTGVNCGDGTDHRIWIRATDNALPTSNQESVDPTIDPENSIFQYDITEPVTDINYPDNGLAYNVQIETFTGTFNDPNFGSGVDTIKILIKRDSDNKEWFGGVPYWQSPGGGNKIDATKINATDYEWYVSNKSQFYVNTEEKYYLYIKAKDYANNYEDGQSDWTVLKSTFFYDEINPAIAISTPIHLDHYNILSEIRPTIHG